MSRSVPVLELAACLVLYLYITQNRPLRFIYHLPLGVLDHKVHGVLDEESAGFVLHFHVVSTTLDAVAGTGAGHYCVAISTYGQEVETG